MKYRKTIYIDMDGVIVDFDAEFLRRFGEELFAVKEEMTSEEFWELFNSNSEDFFLNAPPIKKIHDHLHSINELAEKHELNVEILTAIPKLTRYPTAKAEKRIWLQNNNVDLPMNIGPYAKDKQSHCQLGDILIDDNVLNILQWNKRGGVGIFHHNWDASLKYLKTFLENQDKL